ncbi:uncharacterized protein LOC124147827 [Haliotis rufescens]|uniref:uncharacterized protein LOC124147827 n=1 Tax=Haliotis rufescens TaxID=6454 RepID=UPI00201F7297|nr:uncharacterized protein LOC124147827 [Haliotis rufescens]
MLALLCTAAIITSTIATPPGCVDYDPRCPDIAASGACWSSIMNKYLANCPLSCNVTALCHPSLGDTDIMCRYYRSIKKCEENKENCSYTCGEELDNLACPIPPDPDNTTLLVRSNAYLGQMEHICTGQGCTGNSGGEAPQYCTENRTWVGNQHGVCTRVCEDSMTRRWCIVYNNQYNVCVFRPASSWGDCGRTCDVGALCHMETGETDCQCGEYARKGLCETDAITRNTCPYTCWKRATTSCGPPPDYPFTYPSHNGTQYLDVIEIKCRHGYKSLTGNPTLGCNRFGQWVFSRRLRIFCTPLRPKITSDVTSVTTTFILKETPTGGLTLGYLTDSPELTLRDCLDQCRLVSTCTHVTFHEQTNNCTILSIITTPPRVLINESYIWTKLH